jgi:DNA-binding response OmpR family regulator
MRILIVEDDKPTEETLAKLLRKLSQEDLEIFHARTLAEGIAMSHKVLADITLCDVILPDAQDYHQVGQAIKTGKFFPPVIITTGLEDPTRDMEIYFMKCGAQQVFHKPYVEQVVALIISASAAAAMRKLAQQNPD